MRERERERRGGERGHREREIEDRERSIRESKGEMGR